MGKNMSAVGVTRIQEGLWRIRRLGRSWRAGRWPWFQVSVLVAAVLIAILAPWLAPHSATVGDLRDRLEPPAWVSGGSTTYLLGTDTMGRDILSRLIYGSRVSLLVAGLGITVCGGTGTVLGVLAAYRRGFVDAFIMRAVDVSMAIPSLLVGLTFALVVGPSLWNIILIIFLVYWGRFARQARGEALSIMARDYVAASRVAGGGAGQIMFRHVIPNLLDSMVVLGSLVMGHLILLEATLSFLGVGVPPPAPSWGNMVSEGRGLLLQAPWLSILPGVVMLVVVLAANLLGDWIRDHLDPRLRQV